MDSIFKALLILGVLLTGYSCTSDEVDSSSVDVMQDDNIYEFGLTGSSVLSLTFDDGPSKYTSRLLDILKENNVKATFFVVGANARHFPKTLQRIVDEGHILANHSHDHPNLRKQSNQEVFDQINDTHQVIKKYIPEGQAYYFRAPYGAWKSGLEVMINEDDDLRKYVGPLYWDIGKRVKYKDGKIISAADWECWSKHLSVSSCADGYMTEIEAKDGGVVLLHDIHKKTVDMVEDLIPELIKKGYSFVQMEEVEGLDQYKE